MAIRNGMRYAPPPFCPTTDENLHMFPIPTADPIAARIKPNFDDHFSILSPPYYAFVSNVSFLYIHKMVLNFIWFFIFSNWMYWLFCMMFET
jgi:hypothetical protein